MATAERANYIGLTDLQLDRPIYRVVSLDRMFQLLERRRLVLVKPEKWEDPFENLLLKSGLLFDDGTVSQLAARDRVYGQCWTLNKESDAMWRIYSPDKTGVRLQSTPRKLLAALRASDTVRWPVTCFIGRVEYMSRAKIMAALESLNIFDAKGQGYPRQLLLKRQAFGHEREVRLIYCGIQAPGEPPNAMYEFELDPAVAIDGIQFDPRADASTARALRTAVLSMGYSMKVTKSKLYDPPQGPIRFRR